MVKAALLSAALFFSLNASAGTITSLDLSLGSEMNVRFIEINELLNSMTNKYEVRITAEKDGAQRSYSFELKNYADASALAKDALASRMSVMCVSPQANRDKTEVRCGSLHIGMR